jgi:hypothetical protein
MQNVASGGTSAPSKDRNDLHDTIVSDLVCLIECVRTSMELIDSAVAGEAPLGYQEIATSVVVLDDVRPAYVRARAALNSCEAHLGAALRFLGDTRTPQAGTGEAGRVRRPAHPMGRA